MDLVTPAVGVHLDFFVGPDTVLDGTLQQPPRAALAYRFVVIQSYERFESVHEHFPLRIRPQFACLPLP